jgi:hypothetical protein
MVEEVPFLFRLHKDNPFSNSLKHSGFLLITPKFFSKSDFYVGYRKTHPVGKIILREV